MSSVSVQQLTESVVNALAVIIDANASSDQRRNANALIEDVKNGIDNVFCTQLALNLVDGAFFESISVSENKKCILMQTVRHFGLQLIENTIKSGWNSMNIEMKNELKTLFENILRSNANNVSQDIQLKHGLSKCVVELMKREWPQNWPNFLNTLLDLKRNECVLFIFWRLAEDVGVFYLPTNAQRRREINVEIVANLNLIMQYIADCFAANDIHLSVVSLKALTGFLEWCTLDAMLLSFLCDILGTPTTLENCEMKILVCECLIICLSRKGLKVEERKTLAILFNEKNLKSILLAVRNSAEHILKTNTFSNQDFDLSKRLCYVLSLMGQLVISLNSSEIVVHTLSSFLETQLELFTCENQVLNSLSLQFWRDFIRNPHYGKSYIDDSLIKKLLSASPLKLVKQTFNSKYMAYEFDGPEDYEAFYYKFRAEVVEILRNLTTINEQNCFQFSMSMLKTLLDNENSSKIEWEIISTILDAICNRLSEVETFSSEGLLIFKFMLERVGRISDPDLISSQLSCLSALFIFLPFTSETNVIKDMLDKMFTLALYRIEGQTKQTRSKPVKNLRRHACCAFVKLCRFYPKLLTPLFQNLKNHISMICVSTDELSQMEKCTLNEGLLLISNEFESEIQEEFVKELIYPLAFFYNTILNTQQFISYIGLDVNSDNDSNGQNRANIIYAVNTIVGLLKRVVRKQVLLPSITHLIGALFPLIVNLNSLWKPEYQSLIHSEYKQLAFATITETERLQLLEIPLSSPSTEGIVFKSASHRMQTFLWALHENACSAVGNALQILNPEIYLANLSFCDTLIACEHLPDAKLRMILKHCLKPLVTNCPNEFKFLDEVIFPVIQNFIPFLFRRINAKWESMRIRNTESSEIDNDLAENEVVEDQLCRLLSREFVDLLFVLCVQSKPSKNSVNNFNEDTEMTDEISPNVTQDSVFSNLGELVLRRMPDVLIIASAVSLTWMDSIVSNKSAVLNCYLFRKLIGDNAIKTVDEASFLFQQVLTALSFFGEHEQNQTILLQLILVLYEGIIMRLPDVGFKLKLSEISGESKEKWDNFEEKWMKPFAGRAPITEKRKKEALKSLLSSVIGVSFIAQLYIVNLFIDRKTSVNFIKETRMKSEVCDQLYSTER
ncbi:exportin-5-like protein [Leptotrombidium deliense]|uniref:Exportin-5-like protein n=1 Tax=Leptotrombidium deliense TaxID=299467 RepID=A0A443SJH4_9ACAR|nr:exportin-5-like protein [Leptotrombidium deliense]